MRIVSSIRPSGYSGIGGAALMVRGKTPWLGALVGSPRSEAFTDAEPTPVPATVIEQLVPDRRQVLLGENETLPASDQ